ncbi:hypothetical protein K1T35_05690 [Pseudonocardia sp. DSM 110487]|uniref:hypothetical protein n=1 Tax=Pseudonocardia sp. DSM 110487 TaxID=2865833 RepID=UPI001C6954E7|nr:hypothetical protein [Pseudonocardia sp. DSM 110487]QYN36781.1 hypothetical protein K1T35_05690 [Pseudonocardia sp. DSM 110487]
MTGALVALDEMALATWINVVIMVVIALVVVFVVMWVVRAGTTLTADHLRLDDAFGSRSVPWASIEAIAADAGIAVLVDGTWLIVNSAPDRHTQVRTIAAWWTARRGAAWRPPATVPPTPAQVTVQRRLETEAAHQHSLHRWWVTPAMITGILAAPISLAMAEAIGLRGAVAVVGSVFVVLGSVVVVAKIVSIVRAGVTVRAVELMRALIVLGAIAGVTYTLWSVLTF